MATSGFYNVSETVPLSGGTLTGALGIIAGTVTAPGLFFSGDTNNGIYSPAADNFAITTAGTNALQVTALQNVGIGITSKLARLSVQTPAVFTGTGTVSTTASSQTLTGVGTKFTTELAVGDQVVIGGLETRYIKAIASDTSATLLVTNGVTNTQNAVTFTIAKAIYSGLDTNGNSPIIITKDGRLVISKGLTGSGTNTNTADFDTTPPGFAMIIASTLTDQLILQNTAGNGARLLFSNSISSATAGTQLDGSRDNNLYSGNTQFTIFVGNQASTGSVFVTNINSSSTLRSTVGINTVATSNPSTFTVINNTSVTGVGTVSNSGGGTTVTGVATFFTRQCAIGDRFVVNGETVVITAIASATSLTVAPAIVGANSGVAFTVSKTIASFRDSSGVPQWYVSDQGITNAAAGQRVAVRVVTAAGAITVTTTDYVVEVNKTIGAATVVNLPAGVTGQTFIIKDGKGDAAANNITLTPAAGNIDNAGTYVMATNLQSATIIYDGTMWVVC